MKTVELTRAVDVISQNPWTILVIDGEGRIIECLAFDGPPPTDWAEQRRASLRGCAVREIPQRIVSLEDIQQITDEAVKHIQMFRRYEENQ